MKHCTLRAVPVRLFLALAAPTAWSQPDHAGATDSSSVATAAAAGSAAGVPPGYHVEEHVPKGLVISGGVVFGVFYGLSVASVVAQGSREWTYNGIPWLLVPVVGPFIYIGQLRGSCFPDDGCTDYGLDRWVYGFVGASQVVGAGLLIWGLATKTRSVMPDRESRFYVGPMPVGVRGYGLGVHGRL